MMRREKEHHCYLRLWKQQWPPEGGHCLYNKRTLQLEAQAQAHLHVALTALACDLAEGGAGRAAIYTAPIGVVDPVETVCPELRLYPFGNDEILEQGKVPILEAR